MKKEALIYLAILFLLSVVMHLEEFLSYPIEHMSNLSSSGAYGFGFFHPFIFSLFLYLLVSIPRFLVKLIRK